MATTVDPNSIYSTDEAAHLLGVSPRTPRQLEVRRARTPPRRGCMTANAPPVKYTGRAIAAYLAERTADWPSATATAA